MICAPHSVQFRCISHPPLHTHHFFPFLTSTSREVSSRIEEVSSRIEDARHLRIHHGYAEMMDFLIDVANFQTFTETMKNEFSQ
jgi:hypothetical protein